MVGTAYRPDIDGLRALAVAGVVLFHAFPGSVPGGFIGVDVFFVISGFLITGIIVSSLQLGRFSFAKFYARRVRRIFPALLIVLVAVFAFGWFALLPDEYRRLGRQIASGAGFAANFEFWSEAGYFDTAAQTKPLLHLWSLGIEEQYYIVWPLLLFLLYRFRVSLLKFSLAAAAVSFLWNCFGTAHDASAAFYSPLTRAWELLVGGAMTFVDRNPANPPALRAQPWQGVAGAAMLGAGLFVLDGYATLPVGWAALPVVATCLMIRSGPMAWFNRAVLSARPVVWIGLASYPIYLWHWPLLSYLYILKSGHPSAAMRLAAIGFSVVLGCLTYGIIERPTRRARPSRTLVGGLCVAMVVVGWVGYKAVMRNGFDFRFKDVLAKWGGDGGDLGQVIPGCGLSDAQAGLFRNCEHDRREPLRYALVGDSKAESLFPALVRRSTTNGRWMFIGGTTPIGQPVPVISNAPIYAQFTFLATLASDAVVSNPAIKVVVLTGSTRGLFGIGRSDSIEDLPSSPNFPLALDGLDRMISKLVDAKKKVVLTVDNPTLPDPLLCIGRSTSLWLVDAALDLGNQPQECSIPYDRQLELSRQYRVLLNALLDRHPNDVRLLDTLPILCDRAVGRCRSQMGDRLLYRYTDHVSDFGAGLVSGSLIPMVDAFAEGHDQGPQHLPL